jgi:hypothetical protein
MRKKLMAKKYEFVGGIISQPILQLMKDTFPDAIKAFAVGRRNAR